MPATENLLAAPARHGAARAGGWALTPRRTTTPAFLTTAGLLALVVLFGLPTIQGIGSHVVALGPGAGRSPDRSIGPTAPAVSPLPSGLGDVRSPTASLHAKIASPVLVPSSIDNSSTSAAALASGSPATSSAASAPRPAAATYQTATFFGYVYDARSQEPLSGVAITWASQGGLCPEVVCPSNKTNNQGYFTIVAPAPEDQIIATKNGYLTNFTTVANVTPGNSYGPLDINISLEGIVHGTIEGTDPTHEVVTCTVSVASVSRDSLTIGPNLTTSSGRFSIPVPPFPSVLSFDPHCPQYQSNEYWVNVSAYGSYNIGVVNLPNNDVFEADVFDSVTHQSTNGEYAAIKICSYENPGNCGNLGKTVQNGHPEAWGPPGYDTMTVYAYSPQNGAGALENTTMIGYVPYLPPTHVFVIDPVYVVALGVAATTVNLTYQNQLSADGAEALWGTGMVTITASSLDGFNAIAAYNPNSGNMTTTNSVTTCVGLNSLVGFLVPPLRSLIDIAPNTAPGTCAPAPTWPIPIDLPAWGNETIVNATPNNQYYTLAGQDGFLNLTPGTYVELGVYGAATTVAPGFDSSPVSATDIDTDTSRLPQSFTTEPTETPPPPNELGFNPPGCSPDGTSWYLLCVPVPFGPSEIEVSATGSAGATLKNMTWIDVAPGNYTSTIKGKPIPIQMVDTASLVEVDTAGAVVSKGTTDAFGALAFSNSSVAGRLRINGTNTPPYGAVTITVTPSGTPNANVPPTDGEANSQTGTFSIPASAGWEEITTSSPLYLANTTWVDVSSTKAAQAGTIYLTPLGSVQGQVLTQSGAGILQATAQYCPIAAVSVSACSNIGASGTTNSNGVYAGDLAAYSLPQGAYKLYFTASGFISNWTWVNITKPGELVNASSVTLQSETAASSSSSSGTGTSTQGAAAAEWVDGNVVDNITGFPVNGLSMQWQQPGGFSTPIGSTSINTLDDFNVSLPVGELYINFSAPGYEPFSLFTNVTGLDEDGVDFLGQLAMNPQTFFTGRVELGPANWTSLSTTDGVVPAATVTICATAASTDCGYANPVDLGGFFNASGPSLPGQTPLAKIAPTQAAGTGTQGGGASDGGLIENVELSPGVVTASSPAVLDIFGIVAVQILDASTNNSTPVRFPLVTLINGAGSTNNVTPSMTVGGGGFDVGITTTTDQGPKGGTKLTAISGAYPLLAYVQGEVTNGTVGYGGASYIGNMSLTHFGWVAGIVESSTAPRIPVAWANASISVQGINVSGTANGAGYINVSAAPGKDGNISVGGIDYNTTTAHNVTITESRTALLSSLLSNSEGGITPWGWIRGQVLDSAFGFPLNLAEVSVTSRYGQLGTTVQTNDSGGYFTNAPVGTSAYVSVNLTDYVGNSSRVSVGAGEIARPPLINLTGDGIVAGYVVGDPSFQNVPFANVTLCAPNVPICESSAVANGSGYFWIAAPPGLDNLTVSSANYVSTSQPVNVSSDHWSWVGAVSLDEYAYITGEVIGLPSGIPVNNANVSVCSTLAFSEGILVCPYATLTSAGGAFNLAVPSGDYVLQVNATLYNTTFLPIQLSPGEDYPMGLIELELYGFGIGLVYGQDTLEPVPGAIVTACPTWEVGNCTTSNVNNVTGRYEFDGPPGPYDITATAPGYDAAGIVARIFSGNASDVPAIYLPPIGPGIVFTVQGTVLARSAAPGGALTPFAGAVVSDGFGDAAYSNATGGFTLYALWGDLTVTASAPGYVTATGRVDVRGNTTGLELTLTPQLYTWSGYVTDGIDRAPLPGINITLGGLVLSTTDATGAYSFQLPNGSYDLSAGFPAGSAASLTRPTIDFDITVNGQAGTRDLTLVPPGRFLSINVAESPSDLPIANATVVVAGSVTPEGVGLTLTGATDTNGAVGISLYTGSYNVTASASGYLSTTVTVAALSGSASSLEVNLTLTPVATVTGSASGSGIAPEIGAALAGGVVAFAAVVYLVSRRLSASGRAAAAAPAGPGTN